LTTLIFTGLFQIQQMMFSKREMTVIIPVAKMEKPALPQRKLEVRPRLTVPPKVLEERQLSERGAFVRETYAPPEEKMMVEKEQPVMEKPEVTPLDEEKYVETAREKYKERMEQRKSEEEERARQIKEREEMGRAQEEARQVPAGQPMEEHREESDRRKRYMERRGEMIQEVKTDMFRTSERKEKEKYEKELFKESAPAPQISLEELSEGLDVADLEKIGSLDELGELGFGELEGMGDKELQELAGIAEPEKMPREKGMSCPKCSSKNSTIVYCPYCGKGFCSNCSDSVQRKGDLILYGCPHCKKEVMVKTES
jgi:DNA-directed RNA polymerase subunit RPC12/RpoP